MNYITLTGKISPLAVSESPIHLECTSPKALEYVQVCAINT